MDLTVKLNETLKTGQVVFCERGELNFLQGWKESTSELERDENRQDAIQIAEAAIARRNVSMSLGHLPVAFSVAPRLSGPCLRLA